MRNALSAPASESLGGNRNGVADRAEFAAAQPPHAGRCAAAPAKVPRCRGSDCRQNGRGAGIRAD